MDIALYFEAFRPKTWIASISPVVIATSMASFAAFFDLSTFIATLVTGLSVQIGTNLANDYFDFRKGVDQKERLGPRKLIVQGLLTPKEVGVMTLLSFLVAAISASHLILIGGLPILFLLLLAIVTGVLYSAGPFPLSHYGLGDFFVLFFMGSLAGGMTFFLQTGVLVADGFIGGLASGALSTAILTIDNLRDIDTDRKGGKRSLPLRFGALFGKCEYLLMHIIAFVIPIILVFVGYYSNYLLLAPLALLPAIPLIWQVFKIKDPKDYAPLLPKTAAVLALYTLFFALGLIR